VIYEHEEPWWMMSTGKKSQFIHQSALWQSYQQSHLVKNQENLGKGHDGFLSIKYFFHTRRVLLHAAKSYGKWPPALLLL
jgi:hypothetical protein